MTFLRSLAFAVFTLATVPLAAAGLATPKGEVLLTVTGLVDSTNRDGAAVFDLDMLGALPSRVTETETPWTKVRTRFRGPLGSAVLDAVGAKGTVLHIVALNDYAIDVPVEDFRKWPVILATHKNDKTMPVRDKGPLFIIYPFDLDRGLYNEKYFARSVWQVKSIEVR